MAERYATETAYAPSNGLVATLSEGREDKNSPLAEYGRNEDTSIAHVAQGEVIVPEPVLRNNPALKLEIMKNIAGYGVDPNQFVVSGNPTINPNTGLPEFGLFSKIWKAAKKFIPAVVGSLVLPGIGTALGVSISGAAGAAIGSGIYTKAKGGSWGDTAKAAAISYAGGKALGSLSDAAGFGSPAVTDITQASSFGSFVPSGTADITAGSIGSNIGGSLVGTTAADQLASQSTSGLTASLGSQPYSSAVNAPSSFGGGDAYTPSSYSSDLLTTGAGDTSSSGLVSSISDTVSDLNPFSSSPADITAPSGYDSFVPKGTPDITASGSSSGLVSGIGDNIAKYGQAISGAANLASSLSAPEYSFDTGTANDDKIGDSEEEFAPIQTEEDKRIQGNQYRGSRYSTF